MKKKKQFQISCFYVHVGSNYINEWFNGFEWKHNNFKRTVSTIHLKQPFPLRLYIWPNSSKQGFVIWCSQDM